RVTSFTGESPGSRGKRPRRNERRGLQRVRRQGGGGASLCARVVAPPDWPCLLHLSNRKRRGISARDWTTWRTGTTTTAARRTWAGHRARRGSLSVPGWSGRLLPAPASGAVALGLVLDCRGLVRRGVQGELGAQVPVGLGHGRGQGGEVVR